MICNDEHNGQREHASTRQIGKDEMNLADWSISVSQFEQPRTKEGGKLEYVDHVLEKPDGTKQIVTIQAPTRIGLPTPIETDVLVALFYLASQESFQSDKLHFVPGNLLKVLRWPDKKDSYDRLETALERLTAVYIKYELTWYSKQKSEIHPVLGTGILSDFKLVRRKGRAALDRVPDSFIKWTDHFYESIQSGNLTNLDLDVYFSLKRPGAKQLYRHLNKVWHAGKRPKRYGRDLKQIACGHLGMTDNKDLKRNFDRCVRELESVGYLVPTNERYDKLKKGIWRANFEIADGFIRQRRDANKPVHVVDSHADEIVTRYHQLRYDENRTIQSHERKKAQKLLARFTPEQINRVLSQAAKETHKRFGGKDQYLGAAVDVIERLIGEYEARDAYDAKRRKVQAEKAKEAAVQQLLKQERIEHYREVKKRFTELSKAEQTHWFDQAIAKADSDFNRSRVSKAKLTLDPTRDVLDLFFASVVR